MAQSSDPRPLVALTVGDPAGIGPEICLRALHHAPLRGRMRLLLVGDEAPLRAAESATGLRMDAPILRGEAQCAAVADAALLDLGVVREALPWGVAAKQAGVASVAAIEAAVRLCQSGVAGAMCTAPITKTTLALAGVAEPGHTEILGRLTGCSNFAMMLYSPRLAVAFTTCHQSLASVPASLTTAGIARVGALMGTALRRIRGRDPLMAVLGLNPHAGEEGLFGREEIDIIAPAVERLAAEGWRVEGPIPPDAAFMPHARERYDGHICMYHDQAGIPFKMISLHDGVNITMGLPIVRTSVDHGTAYGIAGTGKADASSLFSALELAAALAPGSR